MHQCPSIVFFCWECFAYVLELLLYRTAFGYLMLAITVFVFLQMILNQNSTSTRLRTFHLQKITGISTRCTPARTTRVRVDRKSTAWLYSQLPLYPLWLPVATVDRWLWFIDPCFKNWSQGVKCLRCWSHIRKWKHPIIEVRASAGNMEDKNSSVAAVTRP